MNGFGEIGQNARFGPKWPFLDQNGENEIDFILDLLSFTLHVNGWSGALSLNVVPT